jgi:hypothetical protein
VIRDVWYGQVTTTFGLLKEFLQLQLLFIPWDLPIGKSKSGSEEIL